MFSKRSLKLLNHLIRQFKSISRQPPNELNTWVCTLDSRHCSCFPEPCSLKGEIKKQKQEDSCHPSSSYLSIYHLSISIYLSFIYIYVSIYVSVIYLWNRKWVGWRESKREGQRENYNTAISQVHGGFKDGIGRLELGEDAFESVLIIDSQLAFGHAFLKRPRILRLVSSEFLPLAIPLWIHRWSCLKWGAFDTLNALWFWNRILSLFWASCLELPPHFIILCHLLTP